MYANGLVNLFIVRIHSCVMSFILFTSEYIQNVDQSPTIFEWANYSTKMYN